MITYIVCGNCSFANVMLMPVNRRASESEGFRKTRSLNENLEEKLTMTFRQGSTGPGVTKLQEDLNRALPLDFPKLKTDGIFGPKTGEWVRKFQRKNPPLTVDGVAGPKTLGKLTSRASTPGKPPMATPPGVASPPAIGATRFKVEMQKEFEKKGMMNQWGAFLDDAESSKIPPFKNFLGTIQRAEDARQVAAFWIELFRITKGVRSQMPTVLVSVAKLDKDALVLFEVLASPTSKFGKFVKGLGEVTTAVGLLVTVVECIQHARRGEPGPVAMELYKFAMGKAVPWAAMIEGVGSLLDGVVPEQTRKNSMLFRTLRAVDPIGLGGVAVDSVVSIVTSGAEMAAAGRVDIDILTNRLTPLVARMKQGPANLFVELGENSGDALYELTQTDIDVNAMLRYSFMELKEWFEKAGSNISGPIGGVRRGTI